MRVPSGDQSGKPSKAGSVVSCVAFDPSRVDPPHVLVPGLVAGERDLRAVRRPGGRGVVGAVVRQPGLVRPVRVHDPDLARAGDVARERDLRTVGRPGRPAVVRRPLRQRDGRRRRTGATSDDVARRSGGGAAREQHVAVEPRSHGRRRRNRAQLRRGYERGGPHPRRGVPKTSGHPPTSQTRHAERRPNHTPRHFGSRHRPKSATFCGLAARPIGPLRRPVQEEWPFEAGGATTGMGTSSRRVITWSTTP